MDNHYTRKNSLRLKGYDYSHVGAYFVTLCVKGRDSIFGRIENGEMILNELGQIVESEWLRTGEIRKEIFLDEYVIMPNHFHAILIIKESNSVGAECVPPVPGTPDPVGAECVPPVLNVSSALNDAPVLNVPPVTGKSRPSNVGYIIAGFKRSTTKLINDHRDTQGAVMWQRSFYDRVIRNERELSLAREYIVNNPAKWDTDRENPD